MVLMNFERDILATHLDTRYLGNNCQIAPISFFCTQDNDDELENKLLHLIILNVTSSAKASVLRMQTSTQYGAKKPRVSRDVTYNRFWLCADLANPPRCFAIITRTAQDSSYLVRQTNGLTFFGSEYCIFEPDLTFQTIGTTPCLSNAERTMLLPCRPFNNISSTEEIMAEPRVTGVTEYFVMNNKPIQICRPKIARDISCSGIQCDRQKAKGECTCLHLTGSSSLVWSFDVKFPVTPRFDPTSQVHVQGFRSLRTTRLFFANFEEQATNYAAELDGGLLVPNRESFREMVEFINQPENGGWTIIGWYMKGSTTDATNEAEKIDNDTFQVHISYLFPTWYIDRIKDNPQFTALQIREGGQP
jgi:hypothetical protein